MKLKLLLPIISLATALPALSQGPTEAGYSFSLLPGDTLSSIFVLDDDPFPSGYSYFISVSGNSGSVTLLGNGNDAQYLSLIAIFTDGNGHSGLAFSMPSSVASTVISDDDTWAQFASAYSVNYGSQSTIENELETHGLQLDDGEEMFPSADTTSQTSQALGPAVYNSSAPEYNPDTVASGELVGFDGAEDIGTFTYTSSVPEPGACTLLACGILAMLHLRPRWAASVKLSAERSAVHG